MYVCVCMCARRHTYVCAYVYRLRDKYYTEETQQVWKQQDLFLCSTKMPSN